MLYTQLKFAATAGSSILLIASGMILTIILINVTWIAYGQIPTTPNLPNVTGRITVTKPLQPPPSSASQMSSTIEHGVKITSPSDGLHIPVGTITVIGISKDNATIDCHVYVIVNV